MSRKFGDRAAWAAVLALAVALSALTTAQALRRYHDFRLGWSWDLAYYNQWYWAFTFGDGNITVRPGSAYAIEGPSVWKTNYLSPLRYLFLPVYRIAPDPRTLLVLHNLLFWWVVPAAFTLVRSETRSTPLGLAAAALVPLTPLLWPFAWNDFRELQVGLPFVLWGVQGIRARNPRLATFGVGGMLACRQELALVAASFAALPPLAPEDVGRTVRWAQALVLAGLGWFLFGFLGYLRFFVASNGPELYLEQFAGPRAFLGETLLTGSEFLAVGLGAWVVWMLAAPRVALLVLPWVWTVSNGRWALRFLGEERWHEVRYCVPMVAVGLAAGLIGFGRVGSRCLQTRGGRVGFAAACLASAVVSAAMLGVVLRHLDRVPHPIDAREAEALRGCVALVGPDDGVLAHYDVTAPLSSRRLLYSYVMAMNEPKGYPTLDPRIGWVFYRNADGGTDVFEKQGFVVVQRGRHVTVLRRDAGRARR